MGVMTSLSRLQPPPAAALPAPGQQVLANSRHVVPPDDQHAGHLVDLGADQLLGVHLLQDRPQVRLQRPHVALHVAHARHHVDAPRASPHHVHGQHVVDGALDEVLRVLGRCNITVHCIETRVKTRVTSKGSRRS